MKKNIQEGFTLLEMISVLVLISLLVLIIFPNIINYVKKNDKQVEKLNKVIYEDAASSYILQNQDFFPEDDGNQFCITIPELIDSGFLKNVEEEEIMNKSVQVEYMKKYKYELVDSSKCIVKYPICTPVYEGDITTGTVPMLDSDTGEVIFTPGDEYRCKVNNREEYTFFVLSQNNDETVNFILDRNIHYDEYNKKGMLASEAQIGFVAWQESELNTDGPVTAMDYLYSATKGWSNVPNINIDYTDSTSENVGGYGGIKTTGTLTKIIKKDGNSATVLGDKEGYENLKVRMPYIDEILPYNNVNLWLYNYLSEHDAIKGDNVQNITTIYGFWTLNSNNKTEDKVNDINNGGGTSIIEVNSNNIGVRPVITLSKDYIRKPIK